MKAGRTILSVASVAAASLALPWAAGATGEGDGRPLVEWSATVGDWYTDEATGVVQMQARQRGIDSVSVDLSLVWLTLDPDQGGYRVTRTLAPLELCGAIAFSEVALRLASDVSPALTDVALEVRSLAGEGTEATSRAVFLVVDKAAGTYRALNCRDG